MSLEVITGPMFSGKSRSIFYAVKRAVLFGHGRAVLYIPESDTRHPARTHDGESVDSDASVHVVPVDAQSLPAKDSLCRYYDLIAVDEVQLMRPAVADSIIELSAKMRVVVAGLDMDYAGRPFPPMDRLLSVADTIEKLTAVCIKCGEDATRSYRKVHDPHKVLVGGSDLYEARCRSCWSMGEVVP